MQSLVAMLVGVAGGALGGLAGLGGGVVMVPLFIYAFHMSQHAAQGTSLGVLLLPVMLPSVIVYWRAGNLDLAVAPWAAVGFALGCWGGGTLAQALGGPTLRRLFAALLVVAALDLLRRP